jgi:putative hydrolase of the HAD superfamily
MTFPRSSYWRPECCPNSEVADDSLVGTPGGLPRAALFDLDDTILATSDASTEGWVLVADRFAPQLNAMGHDVTPERLRTAIHEYRVWFWGDVERNRKGRLNPREALRENVRGGLEMIGVEFPELVEQLSEAWTDLRWAASRAFPGAIETLQAFRDAGVKLGLVTNGAAEIQRMKVEHLGLPGLIDHVQIEGAFGVGKPEPEVYLHALESLGVTPQDTWMIGDNLEFDVFAPMRLGIYGVWVDLAGSGLPEDAPRRPDRIIRSIAELI